MRRRMIPGSSGSRSAAVPSRGAPIEPTVFADVTLAMRVAHEEIFGPVLAVLPCSDEVAMLEAVNGVCSPSRRRRTST